MSTPDVHPIAIAISFIRHGAVVLLARLNQQVLRHWPTKGGKIAIWRVLHRLIKCLNVELIGTTRYGDRFYCDLRDMIQGRIYYTGVWEPSLSEFLQAHVKAGNTFIDVGANIGYFSILAARLVGESGKVIAVEASPMIASKLQRNLTLNQLDIVRVLNVAASDHTGEVPIYRAAATNIGRTSTIPFPDAQLESRVPCMPLSDLLGDELSQAAVIKIDIEGLELLVLNDLLGHESKLRADVVIIAEISPEAITRLGGSVPRLFDAFAMYGFSWEYLVNDYDYTSLYELKGRTPQQAVGLPTSQRDVIFRRSLANARHHYGSR